MKITEKAWKALQDIPYNEYGIKIFEEICTKLDNGTYNGFTFKKIGMNGDKMMVQFKNHGYEPHTWEFLNGMQIYMCDTLCYEDEAKKFLELLKEYDLTGENMNIKEIFDNMNSIEKAEMLELFEKEKETIQAKKDLREIVSIIFALDSDNPEIIKTLAIKFKEWCEWNKYFDFSYNVIAPKGYNVYVLFKMEEERIMTASKFCEFIVEQLESFADTDEHTKDVVREWKEEIKELGGL